MKLNDLDRNNTALKALKANFDMDFNVNKLNKSATTQMLNKVRGLISESKSSPKFYKDQNSPAYLKLMFMEQALKNHYNNLVRSNRQPRIVFENKAVEQAQVTLAAQDMVDSVQKMVEQVNDMLVKELPALTTSIENEIGTNEASSFSQAVTPVLTELTQTLIQAKGNLQNELNGLTPGEGGAAIAEPLASPGEEEVDVEADIDIEPPSLGGEEGEMGPELPAEEPEEVAGGVGRARR